MVVSALTPTWQLLRFGKTGSRQKGSRPTIIRLRLFDRGHPKAEYIDPVTRKATERLVRKVVEAFQKHGCIVIRGLRSCSEHYQQGFRMAADFQADLFQRVCQRLFPDFNPEQASRLTPRMSQANNIPHVDYPNFRISCLLYGPQRNVKGDLRLHVYQWEALAKHLGLEKKALLGSDGRVKPEYLPYLHKTTCFSTAIETGPDTWPLVFLSNIGPLVHGTRHFYKPCAEKSFTRAFVGFFFPARFADLSVAEKRRLYSTGYSRYYKLWREDEKYYLTPQSPLLNPS